MAIQWNKSYHENCLVFTNNIPQKDGGTHLAGFRSALTRTVNNAINNLGLQKKEKINLTGDDSRGYYVYFVSQSSRSKVFIPNKR